MDNAISAILLYLLVGAIITSISTVIFVTVERNKFSVNDYGTIFVSFPIVVLIGATAWLPIIIAAILYGTGILVGKLVECSGARNKNA